MTIACCEVDVLFLIPKSDCKESVHFSSEENERNLPPSSVVDNSVLVHLILISGLLGRVYTERVISLHRHRQAPVQSCRCTIVGHLAMSEW